MNQEYKLYRVSQLLSRFSEQVKILNSNSEFGINIHAENLLIKLLNVIFECDLKNVNYEEGKNYPSIDLRDPKNRIAIQVTSTSSLDKIKSSLEKFVQNRLYEDFDKIIFFIITEKQSTYDLTVTKRIINGKFDFSTNNILDKRDLYLELNRQNDINKIDEFSQILESQFTDNFDELNKWNIYCEGLNSYDKFIQNKHHYLDVKGFSPKINNTLVKLELDKVFVPLKLSTSLNSEAPSFSEAMENYYIEKALDRFKKIVILGDPGSGKSTLLKKLAFNICSKRELFDSVPVIVKGSEFAKYVSDTNRGLAEYLIDHIDKKYAELFASKLHDNKLLVLLDGIDEINQHSLKHSVSERVNAFISQYPDIQIIVSSRVVGYQENCLNGYFTHLTVSKFEKEQIKTFIENWYQALSRNTSQTVDESQELYNSICKNQSVLKMASNPLLVTIIALIHYQGSTLPERRATLYDIATSTLLDNWVKQRNTGKKSIIDKDTLIEILAPVAFTMHENSTTGLICERNLKSKLTEEFKLISSFTNDFNIKKDVKDIIEFLREDAGFLFEKGVDENGESMFGFVHQTFQEYFTAIELKTKWKEGGLQESLKSLVLSSNWHEVIKLTASLFKHSEQSRVGRKDTTNFINQIFLIEDDLIETQRPLSLVVNILGEDTEVERQLFNNIFEAIINCGRQALKNKSNTNISYLLEILLNTQIYKNYVLQKMEALIYDENDNDEQLKYELISTLMSSSNQREVKESLDRVLNGNDIKLKEHMFDNRIVFPISPIVTTELFNSKIVEYVNSDYFNNKKEKRIPTQYTICYEDWRESPLDAAFASIETIKEFEAKLLSRYMAAIENLKDNELKQQLIDDYYDTVSFFSLETLQDYLSQLKQKFPSMSTSVIEKRINFYEEKEKLCLGDDCLVSHQGIRIYPCIDSKDSFAFIKGSVITKLKYPFKKSEIVFEDIADSDSFLEYLNFFLLSYTDPTKDLTIDSKETILLFIKFDDIYDWKRQEQLSPIRAKAFDFLFCDDNLIEKNISNWLIDMYIKHPMISRAIPQNEIHNVDVLIKKIKKSEMPKHEKLCLLLMLGDEHEKENLIKESIIEYQTRTSAAEKDRLHKILAKVM